MVQVDESFRRWRETGDAQALADVYDHAAPTLLRLALHHVRHPATAEDLVQATFLAAIENARSYDAERPLLAWLVGILHNQAKWLMRREGRTVDPTRLAERAERDPLAAAQASEFSAQCDEAIEGLPEAYRPVLRLHLKHQLTAAEIAHALGRPAGTVRSQVVRGLDILRAALPAGVALAAFASLAPARAFDAVREVVLAAGRAHAASALTAAKVATATAFLGGATMKKLMVGVVVLLLLSAGAWWSLTGTADAGRAAPQAPTAETVATIATVPASSPAPANVSPAFPRDEAAAGAVTWRLVGRVVNATGAGVEGVDVRVQVSFERDREPLGDARTDAMGCYAIDLEALRTLPPIDLARAALALAMRAPGSMARAPATLPHRDPTQNLVAVGDAMLTQAAVVSGRVVDRDGNPVAGADVQLGPKSSGAGGPTDHASSDNRGHYRLQATQSAEVCIDAVHGAVGSARTECTLALGSETPLPDLVLQASSTLRARVVFADGEPATRTRLGIYEPGDRGSTVAMARTDDDGSFIVRTLRPGSYDVRLAAFGDDTCHARVATDEDATTIVLGRVHVLRFSFRDEAGRSLRPLDVAMGVWPASSQAAAAFAAGAPLHAELVEGYISAAGSFSSLAVARGMWVRVEASHGDANAEVMVQALPPRNVIDTVLTLRERPRDATLRLQLTTPDRSEPGKLEVHLHQLYLGEPGSYGLEPERTADGLAVRWAAGRYRLEVTPKQSGADFGWFAPFESLVELRSGVTTTVAAPIPIGGRVRFHLHVQDAKKGAEVAGFAVETPAATGVAGQRRRVFYETTPEGWRAGGDPPAGVPLLWAPALPPGNHVLTMHSRDFADVTMTAVVAPREVTDVHVWLQPR